jgi:hypothetical protein
MVRLPITISVRCRGDRRRGNQGGLCGSNGEHNPLRGVRANLPGSYVHRTLRQGSPTDSARAACSSDTQRGRWGSPCITRGRGGWLGLTPQRTRTSYPLPASLAHSELGQILPIPTSVGHV